MAGVRARVKLVEGIQMLGESGSGHTVVMDAAESVGGRNMGIRPMELLLIGMGGRADTEPKVYTEISVHYTITGKGIPAKAVERAINLSEEKYCSASAMLGKTARIESSYEIVEG